MVHSAATLLVRKIKSECGASAVEFSAILPLLFIILSIIIYIIFWFIEFSKFQNFWNVLTDMMFKYGQFVDTDRIISLIADYNSSSSYFTITLKSDCNGASDVGFLFERNKASCYDGGELIVIVADIEARLGSITSNIPIGNFDFTKTIAAPK
jgi:hypothetical protein